MDDADLEILREVADGLKFIGLGPWFGYLGNNNAYFGDLLCDGRNGHVLNKDGNPRKCTLNSYDLHFVQELERNNRNCLRYKEQHLYEKLTDLIGRMSRKEQK